VGRAVRSVREVDRARRRRSGRSRRATIEEKDIRGRAASRAGQVSSVMGEVV
jgi:hypothetical protein